MTDVVTYLPLDADLPPRGGVPSPGAGRGSPDVPAGPAPGREARRQQALLAAILEGRWSRRADLPTRQQGAAAERGLLAYRVNAQALAQRALAAAYPTLERMVGAEAFPGLAWAHWRAHPPTRGDLGQWGSALPDWVAAEPSLAEWPWLADSARLDWAVHVCESAADAVHDPATLGLLAEHDPGELGIDFLPGTALLDSVHPIVSLRALHAADAAAGEVDAEALRHLLAAGRGEPAIVWRQGFRARVQALDAATAAFTADLLAGVSLGTALDTHAAQVDFTDWLHRALSCGWMKGVALHAD
jgi:hypothetical protein